MSNELNLSKDSKKFIENLRVYLFSSGKNSEETEDIIKELEIHLFEAEKDGKSIDKIIGQSPKAYMESVSKEMPIDYHTWIPYICLIIFGSFSFTILPDFLEGNLSYSVLEIAGHVGIGALFVATVLIGFKYISTSNLSNTKYVTILAAISILPITLFVGLIYLERVIETPMIHFGSIGSLIIGSLTVLLIIGASIWAKSWVLIIVIALVTLPDYVLEQTALKHETQLILSSIIMFGGVGIYLWIVSKVEKSKD